MSDFTYDVATDRGKVRLYLGDSKEKTAWFTDAEIDVFLDEAGSVNGAICLAANALLADRARRARSWSGTGPDGQPMAYDDTAQVAALQALIESRGGLPSKTYPQASVLMPAPLPMDDAFDINDP